VVGENKAYLVDRRRMWAWANGETDRVIQEEKRRLGTHLRGPANPQP